MSNPGIIVVPSLSRGLNGMNGSYWSQQGCLLYPRIKTFLHKQNSVRNGGKQRKLL